MHNARPHYTTRASLRQDLTRIGLQAGDTVMLHAAMRKAGPLLNGPDALTNAILDVAGPDGTMLVNTSWDSIHDELVDAGPMLAFAIQWLEEWAAQLNVA